MSDHKDTSTPVTPAGSSTPDEPSDFAKKWVGTTTDDKGVVRERRVMKGDKPFKATFDENGKLTGFGIV